MSKLPPPNPLFALIDDLFEEERQIKADLAVNEHEWTYELDRRYRSMSRGFAKVSDIAISLETTGAYLRSALRGRSCHSGGITTPVEDQHQAEYQAAMDILATRDVIE